MRVLAAVVVPPHLSVSGASRAAEHLTEALAGYADVDIDIANMSQPAAGGVPHGGGSTPRRLPVRTWNPLGWTRRFLPNRYRTLLYGSDLPRKVAHGGYDLVHLHNPTPSIEMMRVARAARRAGVPYVISTHGFVEIADGPVINAMGRAQRAVWAVMVDRPVRWAVRHATRMFLLSPADRPVVDRLDGAAVPASIVPNGVAVPADVDPADDREHLERIGVATRPEGLTAFFLANHTPNKGVDVLLEAFAGLDLPFTLVVGGDQREVVDYASFAARCSPDQRIVYPGRLSDEEVGALFRWADLFVFPTRADTLPLVVLEAMAHGTPVVASSVGGIPYELEGGCGVLVPPGDVAALQAAITELAADPDRLAEMAGAARQRVLAHFTWPRAGAAAHEAYRLVLGR
jgi:glycosyltransferase involved in cell wall biosynthesis